MSYQPVESNRNTVGRSSFGSTRDLVSLLFRRKGVFLAIFVTIFAAALLSTRDQQIVYVAEAKVFVYRGIGPQVGGQDQRIRLQWWEEMKTERVTAQSRPVAELAAQYLATAALEDVSDSPEVAGLPRATPTAEELMEGRGVEVMDETDYIRFIYRAIDQRGAIQGVNALARAYVEHGRGSMRATEASQAFEDVADTKRARIGRLEAEIAALSTQHNIADINSEAIELTRHRRAIETDMVAVRSELEEREREIEIIKRSRIEHPDILVPTEELTREPNLLPYTRRLAELSGKLNTLLATYTRDNPQVRAVERDIEACQVSIRREVDNLLVAKRNSVETLRAKHGAYKRDLARISAKLAAVPALQAELDALTLELRSSQKALADVQERQLGYILQSEVGPRAHRLRLAEPAVSAKRVGGGARKQLFAVFSLVLGLGLGFVGAFVIDTLDHSIKFPSDLEDSVGVPMLASIREVSSSWAPPAEPDALGN